MKFILYFKTDSKEDLVLWMEIRLLTDTKYITDEVHRTIYGVDVLSLVFDNLPFKPEHDDVKRCRLIIGKGYKNTAYNDLFACLFFMYLITKQI